MTILCALGHSIMMMQSILMTKVIEGNIQGLKQFETEYRARLTEFLGQLVSQVSDTNNYDQDSQDD